MVQFSIFRHFLYWMFCWMLLLKKPCTDKRSHVSVRTHTEDVASGRGGR